MKLLVLTGKFYPDTGGGALEDYQFVKEANKKGHEICVMTSKSENVINENVGYDIIRPLRKQPKDVDPASVLGRLYSLRFILVLLYHSILLIHSQNFHAILSTGYSVHPVAKIAGMLNGIPTVTYVSFTASLDNKTFLINTLETILINVFSGDLIVCRSNKIQDLVTQMLYLNKKVIHVSGILDEEKIREVHKNTQITQEKNKIGIRENDILLCYVGRLVDIKRPGQAIRILKELPEKYKLLIVGDGPMLSEIEDLVKEPNSHLSDRVWIFGQVSHSNALKYIHVSDAVLITSRAESYSAVGLESLALGGMVFSTPVGILDEISHERLKTANVYDLSDELREYEWQDQNKQIDEGVLLNYSSKRYTGQVLDAIHTVI